MVFGKNGVQVEENSVGGQCEVAEGGEDRLEVIFTLGFFLGIWKMDAHVAMTMEIFA